MHIEPAAEQCVSEWDDVQEVCWSTVTCGRLFIAFNKVTGSSDIWSTADGDKWEQEPLPSDIWDTWSHLVFDKQLFVGAALGDDTVIFRRKPAGEWENVLSTPQTGTEYGAFMSLGTCGTDIYAGMGNAVFTSASGRRGSWTRDYCFETAKHIYLIAELHGKLWAFEGEPHTAPSRIYVKDDGGWRMHSSHPDIRAFGHHLPGNRVRYGGDLQVCDDQGRLFSFDGESLHQDLSFPYNNPFKADKAYRWPRAKVIGDELFCYLFMGTAYPARGTLLVKNGFGTWSLLLEGPARFEIDSFKGNLYLALNHRMECSEAFPYGMNHLSVRRLPLCLPRRPYPHQEQLFPTDSAAGVAGIHSRPFSLSGYDQKQVLFEADAAGTLSVQVQDIRGEWVTVQTTSTVPDQPTTMTIAAATGRARLLFHPDRENTTILRSEARLQ